MTATTRTTRTTRTTTASTDRQLLCGAAAGPLFLTVWAAQAFTRAGFDPMRHPASLLSLGEHGWVQVANFVVTGALVLTCAAGLREGGAGRLLPRLVGAFGAGLVLAGVFVTDPGAGYPAGAPAGAPEHISWHGWLHEGGFAVTVLGITAACLVAARRAAGRRAPRWALACAAVPVAAFGLVLWPVPDGFPLRLVAASAVWFAFVAALALRARRGLPV